MRHFCTYFDRHYLAQGLVLYSSLCKFIRGPFRWWVLCLDEEVRKTLESLRDTRISCLTLAEIEAWDPDLLAAKPFRSRVEYYWTSTPVFLLQLLRHKREIDVLTYVDADICFYNGMDELDAEFSRGSVLIIGHRFPARYQHLEAMAGRYNVGLMMFRSDRAGLEVLAWWRERCLEWCYDRPEDGKYGDQKYLDDWPTRFPNVVVSTVKGAGIGPWNLSDQPFSRCRGRIMVEGSPLIFYHYHGVRRIGPRCLMPYKDREGYPMDSVHSLMLYASYARELFRADAKARRIDAQYTVHWTTPWPGFPSFRDVAFQRCMFAWPLGILIPLWKAVVRWERAQSYKIASDTCRRAGDRAGTLGNGLAALRQNPFAAADLHFLGGLLRALVRSRAPDFMKR